jgi:alkylhydroperoxidase family enzyme
VRSDSSATGLAPREARGPRFFGPAAAVGLRGCLLFVGVFAFPGPTGPTVGLEAGSVESQHHLPAPPPVVADQAGRQPRFVPLTDTEAWARLPERTSGTPGPLPNWARVLVRALPRTTAAMLELDYLVRTSNQLDPGLRGQIRWAAAHASRSAYGEAYALADLRAAGLGEVADRLAAGNLSALAPANRASITFAEKLTTDPHSITDAEVAALIDRFGERPVVAMVLVLAYAQFQDRLVLALDLPVESGGPVSPIAARFAKRPFGVVSAPPPRRPPTGPVTIPAPDGLAVTGWQALDQEHVRCSLDDQRARRPRIRLPAADEGANRWGLVGQTYQPELGTAWSSCTQAFGEEANQDPVFEQSVFWVVTATKGCFY